ncbi:hypothetical protein B0T24DRAFT_678403 [Lasiosphaeria ovina]|uniref:Uncharacterized protein n=1 Tax=Lasiosphaeria ovina TaxID=92902 RepID=A0AAE0KB02_9PEZI|nr:hypothetical protein B0T24DRAFT_678403 [Lasiosphaeria ovina]
MAAQNNGDDMTRVEVHNGHSRRRGLAWPRRRLHRGVSAAKSQLDGHPPAQANGRPLDAQMASTLLPAPRRMTAQSSSRLRIALSNPLRPHVPAGVNQARRQALGPRKVRQIARKTAPVQAHAAHSLSSDEESQDDQQDARTQSSRTMSLASETIHGSEIGAQEQLSILPQLNDPHTKVGDEEDTPALHQMLLSILISRNTVPHLRMRQPHNPTIATQLLAAHARWSSMAAIRPVPGGTRSTSALTSGPASRRIHTRALPVVDLY